MRRCLFPLLLCLLSGWGLFAQDQLIISHDIDFGDSTQVHYLHTTRGDQFVGRLLQIRDSILVFKLQRVARPLELPLREVTYVGLQRRPDKAASADEPASGQARSYAANRWEPALPPAQRLLYAATALPMEGRGSFRNVMVLYNEATRQFSEYFNVSAGAIVPAVFSARVQGRVSLNELVHIGIAAQYFLPAFDPEFDVLHPYFILTIGEPKAFVNFHYGKWLDLSFDPFHQNMLGMGGSYVLSPRWRLYAEGMVVWDDFDTLVFPIFMAGHSWRRNTIEFGISVLPESDIVAIPVVGFSMRFER
ncbi:MAG: hypothetical protein KDC54_24710 [Lewinella sp.]|nr:hypothetical protein [Lewinella sp.]